MAVLECWGADDEAGLSFGFFDVIECEELEAELDQALRYYAQDC